MRITGYIGIVGTPATAGKADTLAEAVPIAGSADDPALGTIDATAVGSGGTEWVAGGVLPQALMITATVVAIARSIRITHGYHKWRTVASAAQLIERDRGARGPRLNRGFRGIEALAAPCATPGTPRSMVVASRSGPRRS